MSIIVDNIVRKKTSSVKWDKMIEINKDENMLPFWIADSDYQTAPCIIETLTNRIQNGAFGYGVIGDDYYEAIIDWNKNKYKIILNKNDIFPETGVVTGLAILIRALSKENDGIIIMSPVYSPFFDLVLNQNRKLLESPLINNNGYFEMDFKDIESKLPFAKILIVCNPHNPVGRVYNKLELDRLVNLCKNYGVFLISDEVHCDLILGDNQFHSVKNYLDVYKKISVLSSPSKTFNVAGLISSYVVIRDEETKNLYQTYRKNHFYAHQNIFGVLATTCAYNNATNWVNSQLKYLTNNFNYLKDFFAKYPKAIVTPTEGTYLAWVDLSYLGLSGDEINQRLLKNHVMVSMGSIYGKDYSQFIRINFACSLEQLTEGLKRIEEALLK